MGSHEFQSVTMVMKLEMKFHWFMWLPKWYPSDIIGSLFSTTAGGYLAGSLAIMTDAAHMLSDFAGFLISLLAIWVGSRPPSKRMSFGWHRAGVYVCVCFGVHWVSLLGEGVIEQNPGISIILLVIQLYSTQMTVT